MDYRSGDSGLDRHSSELPAATVRDFLRWVLRRRKRFRVKGLSMLPLLQPDEEVLVDLNAYGVAAANSGTDGERGTPQPGDIVIVQHPHRPALRMIKRIVAVLEGDESWGDGARKGDRPSPKTEARYWVEGDNRAASTDSRCFGAVPQSCILGKVVTRFP